MLRSFNCNEWIKVIICYKPNFNTNKNIGVVLYYFHVLFSYVPFYSILFIRFRLSISLLTEFSLIVKWRAKMNAFHSQICQNDVFVCVCKTKGNVTQLTFVFSFFIVIESQKEFLVLENLLIRRVFFVWF